MKKKSIRILVTIECILCRTIKNNNKGVSRYITSKNKKNTLIKLELKKYCKYCNLHTFHKEIK